MKKKSEPRNALTVAFGLLSRRSYSEREIREKLTARNFSHQEIEEVIGRLTELGYLDDRGLAERLAAYRFEEMGHGPWKIREYLRRRKIPPEVVEAVVGGMITKEEAVSRGVELLKRRAMRGKFDISAEKGKIFRYLAGRGYSPDVVREIISEYERIEREGDEG